MAKPRGSGNGSRSGPSLDLERREWRRGLVHVAGVDETGRGPLAGPVVVCAVILGPHWDPEIPLADSKQLPAEQRDELYEVIRRDALATCTVAVNANTVDRMNVLAATMHGMKQAVQGLGVEPDYVLVDGNHFPDINYPGEALVKGDSRSCSIAAASILAKVSRDRIMQGLHLMYPDWQFARHKGYPTTEHKEALETKGRCLVHRRSFRPVKKDKNSGQLSFW